MAELEYLPRTNFVGVVKLGNTLASGASAVRLEGSTPSSDTDKI